MTNLYPRKLLLITVTMLLAIIVQASYLRNVPQKLTQPNGEVINCFATGDEFYHWLHDEEGYTIVQNPQNGYFCYATLVNDELIPSQHIVGKVNPAAVGLRPKLNISAKKKQAIRENFLGLEKKYRIQTNTKSQEPQKVNTTGTINNIVVYIRFSDESGYTTNQSVYTTLFNSTTAGTLSLHNYYNEVSYGTLDITTSFLPTNNGTNILSYKDSHTRQYFMKYDANSNPTGYTNDDARVSREHTLLQAAINYVSGQLNTGLNIDNDNDGNVDNVCFIVQGAPAGWSELLWPHRWSLYSKDAFINGKKVKDYNFQLQNALGVSVLCHEMFHTLGAPDLYHYNEGNPDPVGVWDIMNMDDAQHMTQYMKYYYGRWLSNIPEITTSGDYSLNPVFVKDNSCYKIKSPYSSTEYFVIEYRKKEKLDAVLPSEGLLVYRIDGVAEGQGNRNGPPDELYIYRPNGSLISEGNLADAPFSANKDKTSVSDKTNPNTFLSAGGVGGLNISNISTCGSTISFHVDIVSPVATDVAVTKIISPESGILTSSETVKVNVSNMGTSSITSGIKVNLKLNDGSVVSEDFVGTLAAGATLPFQFNAKVDLSNTGSYKLKVYTTLSGDLNKDNDTVTTTINNNQPLEYLAPLASTFIGTYNEISTGTIIAVDKDKDGLSAPIDFPDGFKFNFCAKEFSKFILSTNGFIKLGDTNPSTRLLYFSGPQVNDGGIFNSSNASDNFIIAPFNHNLVPGNGGASYRMEISGVAPDRVVTIQFKNVRDNDALAPNQFNSMNFQVKLYETTNVIEFVFGQWTGSPNASAYKTAISGLRGQSKSNDQLLALNKGSLMEWASMTFSNKNYEETATLNFGNGERPAPEVGRTYRMTPRKLNDLAILKIYTMGYLPLNYATPHVISAAIVNYGTATQNNVNLSLSITGSNSFNPSATIVSTIEPLDTIMVNFANFSPTVLGDNTITISLPDDDFTSNNSKSIQQTTVADKFGYALPAAIAESAYTFSPSAVSAVCKYHINGTAKVSSVEAMILNNSVMTGKKTTAYVYNASGVKIGQSNLFTVTSSNLGKWVTFAINQPPQVSNTDFYVGLDCSSSYFAAYETEVPTRVNTYFKLPSAGGSLVEFGSNAALLYRAVLSPATSISSDDNLSINVYSNNKSIFVNLPEIKSASEVLVYNILGNLVYKNLNPTQGLNTIEGNFNAGTYIVKVMVGNEVKTQKVVIGQ